ncbi:plasmid pRiA4b ORF-3 family protein [Lederbergia sp. NSJ-179]|uniref:plasmid pRiA4b ORF-3 family protein n=1 Tax=Lederbergia sp. NSJ-179 TaxID=2931402 RepID=UPI001FD61211|nr:plasmid pRiA4b ORF-3 family protein [Lederbergia sp. NSJ-179]MCJ7841281.1 plasmid pRiA4b ORF-3 family protein [Lederbergia sp. NSJ-179]
MLIQCTKKLLDQLQCQPESNVEEESLFSWHANLIRVNQRKTVVLVNDQNRYVVLLYGLKKKNFSNIDEIIAQGIRETFRGEGIKEEVIEKYLLHSKTITYAKTKDHAFVARMNHACKEASFYADLLEEDSIFQGEMSNRISRSWVGDGKNDYFSPNEILYQNLESFVGKPIFATDAVRMKVTLELENHSVWRRIVVPLNRTFHKLHKILQVAFGWQDYHLHEFYIYDNTAIVPEWSINHSAFHKEGHQPVINLVCDEEAFAYPNEAVDMKLEKGIRLSEFIPVYKKLKYTYDFGDNWQHYIDVEKVIDNYDSRHPVCLEGEGNTPPEDVGGEFGYEEFLEIFSDPEHPQHDEMNNWAKMQLYENFDLENINHRLKRM